MPSDHERIDALERTVRLLAEATRDALEAMRDRGHVEFNADSHWPTRQIDRALGWLDTALSGLGVECTERVGEESNG